MYHFVKFNNTWYLKPEKIDDIIDHFKKFCGREFEQGFNDFKDNISYAMEVAKKWCKCGGNWTRYKD